MAANLTCIAIETATEQASVALCSGQFREQRILSASRNSAREVYVVISELLRTAGCAMRDVDLLAVGHGPGSFTGVRVGVSAAQALAYALDKPVCTVSTLGALAVVAARELGAARYAVCLDARMHEAYLGIYDVNADGTASACVVDALVSPKAFAPAVGMEQACAVGSGWRAYPALLHASGLDSVHGPDIWPDALAVTTQAEAAYAAGQRLTPASALPNYLRNEVAHPGATAGQG